ncbi:hypothetical protein [Janibacter alittae]|uniref:Uncharacterized protein n=1 Tax=Janibacter alittae TaxID=3115209 RepID=A0ABZ2MII3_9MICO
MTAPSRDRESTSVRALLTRDPTATAEALRALVAAIGLLGWVTYPDRHTEVLVAFGFATALLLLPEARAAGRLPRGGMRRAGTLRALAPAVGGLCLVLVAHDEHLYRLAIAIGVLLLVRGLADLLASRVVPPDAAIQLWLIGLGLAELAGAVAGLVRPELFGQFSVAVVGLVWLAMPVLTVLAPAPSAVRGATTAPYIKRGELDTEVRATIEEAVGGITRARL